MSFVSDLGTFENSELIRPLRAGPLALLSILRSSS